MYLEDLPVHHEVLLRKKEESDKDEIDECQRGNFVKRMVIEVYMLQRMRWKCACTSKMIRKMEEGKESWVTPERR